MIQFILRLTSRSGGTPDMVKALRSVMLPTSRKPGCQRCQLCSDVGKPESLCYVEDWTGSEALDRHIMSEHFSKLLSVIESAAAPPLIDFRLVSDLRGLEYIEIVRSGGRVGWEMDANPRDGSASGGPAP